MTKLAKWPRRGRQLTSCCSFSPKTTNLFAFLFLVSLDTIRFNADKCNDIIKKKLEAHLFNKKFKEFFAFYENLVRERYFTQHTPFIYMFRTMRERRLATPSRHVISSPLIGPSNICNTFRQFHSLSSIRGNYVMSTLKTPRKVWPFSDFGESASIRKNTGQIAGSETCEIGLK